MREVVRGGKRIADALGCSQATVTRLVQKGLLPARKIGAGGRTSPLIVDRAALDALKRRMG